MKNIRKIHKTFKSQPTIEGAGVKLKRAFGNPQVPLFDPFLLLDDFHSSNPEDYLAGFPQHPHRGIETITYMLRGRVNHKDSMGNSGVAADPGTGGLVRPDRHEHPRGTGARFQRVPKRHLHQAPMISVGQRTKGVRSGLAHVPL